MISISIMAHPSRKDWSNELYLRLKQMPFSQVTLIEDSKNSEWETGKEALLAHDKSDYHCVIQDDAIIADTFYENLERAIESLPTRSLLSLYTGTTKPQKQRVQQAVDMAQDYGASYLSASTLLWGVCIAIPTEMIDPMLNHVKNSRHLYDRRIGQFFKDNNMPVYYSFPSLVDHRDEGSLIKHDVKDKRVAHYFEFKSVDKWKSSPVIDMGV